MLTNEELIKRYNKFAMYYETNKYNKDDLLKYNFYPGKYDFDILKLIMKDMEYIIIKDNKYYINQENPFIINIDIDIHTTNELRSMLENEGDYITTYEVFVNLIKDNKILKLSLKDFISFYPKFCNEYHKKLKKLKTKLPIRLVMISIKECDFCYNPRNEYIKIQENVNTKVGYRFCSDCAVYSNCIFLQKRVKRLTKKLRIFTKSFGKLMLLYYKTLEKRYQPYSPVYYEAEKNFYKLTLNQNL